jgi:hypothetical protein
VEERKIGRAHKGKGYLRIYFLLFLFRVYLFKFLPASGISTKGMVRGMMSMTTGSLKDKNSGEL